MKKTAIFLSLILSLCTLFIATSCSKRVKTSSYEITAELDGSVLTGSENVTFYNSSDTAIEYLKFNLYPNAFRENAKYSPILSQYKTVAYPDGASYGDMQINSVTYNGENLSREICGQDQNVLKVYLQSILYPEESVTVTIDFTVNIANVISRTGKNSKTINLANFYPILCCYDGGFYECLYYSIGDPFFSDCALYTVNFKCDAKYTVASSGELIEKTNLDGKDVYRFTIDNARSFAMVLGQGFNVLCKDYKGVSVQYYYYQDQDPNASMGFALSALELFSEKFGEYGYNTYSVVQTPFIQGGMEFTALVMVSDDLKDLPYGEVIVHETAHQWWQTMVGNNEIEYGFLDEGLAEYSVVLFYENYPEYRYTRENLIKASENTYKVFCSVYDKINGKVNTVMTRSLKDFSSEYEYVNIAYVKPCIMYDYLRRSIGEERFFSALKRYFESNKFKNVTPDHLVGAFEKTGADSNGFLYSFFEGKAII